MARKPAKGEAAEAPPKKKQSAAHTAVWLVLLLIILGLGGYGAANFSSNVRSIGSVGGTPIPVVRYQREVSQQLLQLRQMGLNVGLGQALAMGLPVDQAALSNVVNQVALENEAYRLGLSVGDAELRRQLTALPDFQGPDGKFDPEFYKTSLQRMGLSVGTFEDQIRAAGARALLQRIIASGPGMPAVEADTLYQWTAQRRSFIWAELSDKDLSTPIPAATEADLKGYYEAHPDDYTLPETRKITYAWITPTMLVDKIDVPEDELRKLYDSRADQYHQPERRLVERLVFGTEDEAKTAWDRLQAGETDFETLVADRGLTLDDINLDEVTKEQLGPAGDAVFALTEPGLVGPVDSDLGPAILRVNGILDAQDTPFEEVRDELKQDYATDQARRMISDMTENVNDLLAGGATLEEVASETDLELGTVDWRPDVSEGIAGYSAFRDAAAKVTKDDFPEAVGLDDGGLFALRLDEIVPPTLQPFDDVSEKVTEDWTNTTTQDALNKLADELIPRIEAGEAPESFGIDVNHEDALTRDAFLADTPDGLVAKAFGLEPGKAARIPGTKGTPTVAIVSTTEILPPDPDNAEMVAKRDAIAQQVDAGLKNDILTAYTRAVGAGAGVKIDQQAVSAVNGQFN